MPVKSSVQINRFFLSGGNEDKPILPMPPTCIYFKLKKQIFYIKLGGTESDCLSFRIFNFYQRQKL